VVILRSIVLSAFLAVANVTSVGPAPANLGPEQSKNPGDPAKCPWCHNNPDLLKAAGLVSHGPFAFGKYDTKHVHELLPEADIRWVETAHFRIGFALGEQKVKLEEKKKILGELTRLKEFFPDVKPETQILDPWMRTHLYAQRCEDCYKHFVDLFKLGDKKFKGDPALPKDALYHGEGPYLGMLEKYEILVLPTEASHYVFLVANSGLPVKRSQRWHYIERGVLGLMCHAEQGRLRTDMALHGHIAFNIAHNLLDGLNHYSYDTPVWYHEGLAHYFEREVDPNYNSFDSGEGAAPDTTSKSDWKPEVLKLIAADKAPRLAELMALPSYAELKLPHHFATWSMIDFLIQTKPEEFAKFIWMMKQNVDDKKLPSGTKLGEWHRKCIKECFGWNYQEFDDAWKAWARDAYKPGPPKSGDPNSVPMGGPPVPGAPVGGGVNPGGARIGG
jgi:hypothetical protein